MEKTNTKNVLTISGVFMFLSAGASTLYAATPQQEMSRTVEQLCPALKKAYTANPASLNGMQQDVLLRCGELKLAPGQSYSDFTEAQLIGLGYMTGDENSAMGTASVELSGVQNIAVLGRLSILRAKATNSVATVAPGHRPQATLANSGNDAANTGRQSLADSVGSQQSGQQYGDNYLLEQISGRETGFSQMADYGRWGFFMNGSYGFGDKDMTSMEPGFEFDSWSLTTGVDYRLTEQFILGISASYASTMSSLDNGAGDVDLDGFGLAVYGTYYVSAFYLDFLAGVGTHDFETERNLQYGVPAATGGRTTVTQTFDGDTDANDVNLSAGAGYNASFGSFMVTPFLNVAYQRSDIDGYTESLAYNNTDAGYGLALRYGDQKIESLTSSLGVHLTRTVNTTRAVLTPYVRADWEHEYENDSRTIVASFAVVDSAYASLNEILIPTDEPDRDYFNLGAGILAALPNGWQLFLDYATILGYEDLSLHRFVTGLRWEF